MNRSQYLDFLERDIREAQARGSTMEPLLQFFEYKHLPPHLQTVSMPFHNLAHNIVEGLPRNPERTAALRKLLEAKDCAVRAMLYVDPPQGAR